MIARICLRGLSQVEGKMDILFERIFRLFYYPNLLSLSYPGLQASFRIKLGSQTIVRSGHPRIFRIVHPTCRMIVLAAAAAEGIHHEEGALIGDTRRMIFAIADHHIRGGKVSE